MTNRLTFIDFAKGCSIVTIVLMHALMATGLTGIAAKAILFGGTGVHVFILLSGFGLGLSRPTTLPDYLRRRFWKILAPYYMCVTVIFALNGFFARYPDGLYAYLGHLFLYKMFDESIIGSFGYPFWFLSTIIQLYLLFPILRMIKDRWGHGVLLTVGVGVSVGWWIFVAASDRADLRIYNSFCLQYLWEFCLGISLAELYLKKQYRFWELPTGRAVLLTVGGLTVYATLVLGLGDIGKIFNDIPALVGYLGLIILLYPTRFAALAKREPRHQRFNDASEDNEAFAKRGGVGRLVSWIGVHSYAIYLWHQLVIDGVMNITK